MDYKKKYKQLHTLISDLYPFMPEYCKEKTEGFFPELAGSKDERIRKALLEMVHDTTGDELWVDYNVHKEEALSWLEKQGEQKPTDKVEPKFKVGDWITNDRYIKMVVGIGTKGDTPYYYMFKDGTTKYIDEIDKKYHLWTIQDAKDGDVLACENGRIGIFKCLNDNLSLDGAWSEEDEHRVKDTIYFLDTAKKHYASTVELDACIYWLKSLKERLGG